MADVLYECDCRYSKSENFHTCNFSTSSNKNSPLRTVRTMNFYRLNVFIRQAVKIAALTAQREIWDQIIEIFSFQYIKKQNFISALIGKER
jgi:hypothetical protein